MQSLNMSMNCTQQKTNLLSVRQELPLQFTWFIGRERVKSLSRLKHKYDNMNTIFKWKLEIKTL